MPSLWTPPNWPQRLAELQAPTGELKEAPLRRDVRSLGMLLGEVLREQAGLPVFEASPCSSLAPTLAAGTSCTVNVFFSPTSIGAKSANLHVVGDSPVTPTLDATLSGTGVLPTYLLSLTKSGS